MYCIIPVSYMDAFTHIYSENIRNWNYILQNKGPIVKRVKRDNVLFVMENRESIKIESIIL